MWFCHLGNKSPRSNAILRYWTGWTMSNCQQYRKHTVKDKFVNHWTSEIQNSSRNLIIRYYNSHKTAFCMEQYIDTISDIRYRTALTRLRTSSHTLEIERGRYTVPRTLICDRLCINCNDVEDEIYFLVHCKLYEESKNIFHQKVARRNSDFVDFTDHEKYFFWWKPLTHLSWRGLANMCSNYSTSTQNILWCYIDETMV